jgi:hypothetical protein
MKNTVKILFGAFLAQAVIAIASFLTYAPVEIPIPAMSDDGSGEVTIMDVQSDGHRLYWEQNDKVNLDKIITPDGSVISYEEYQKIRAAR